MESRHSHDLRIFPRRATNLVAVWLRDPAARAAALPGWVLDYSPAGLTVKVDQAIAVGTQLTIEAILDEGKTRTFEVRVQNCMPHPGHWRLGCAFTHTQHWDSLRVFG